MVTQADGEKGKKAMALLVRADEENLFKIYSPFSPLSQSHISLFFNFSFNLPFCGFFSPRLPLMFREVRKRQVGELR